MIQPPISDLLEKVENRYILVIATAKRARMLTEGAQPLAVTKSNKDVTIAIMEIKEGKVRYRKISRDTDPKVKEQETGVTDEKTVSVEALSESEPVDDEIKQEETLVSNEPETDAVQTEVSDEADVHEI